MLLREVLPAIFLRGVFTISSDSNNKKPLTFRIVDSAMGVGKSQCLMEHIRFSTCRHGFPAWTASSQQEAF